MEQNKFLGHDINPTLAVFVCIGWWVGVDNPEEKCDTVALTHLLWSCESPLDGSLVYHPMQCQTVVDVQEKSLPLKTMTF